MNKKISIAVDFDGVIHSVKEDIDLPFYVVQNKPNEGAIEWLRELLSNSEFELYIYSCRCRNEKGITAMYNWLLENGLEESLVEKIIFAKDRKPNAKMFLDDKGMKFVGIFPSLDEIRSFEPYYMNRNKL